MIKTPPRDALAGLSVAGLMVPEAVAYASIAGLAPDLPRPRKLANPFRYFYSSQEVIRSQAPPAFRSHCHS